MSPHIGQFLIGPEEWIKEVQWGMQHPDEFSQKYKSLGMHFVAQEQTTQ